MAIFENYPYTNQHNLNLDYVLDQIAEVQDSIGTVTQYGDRLTAVEQKAADNESDIDSLTPTVSGLSTTVGNHTTEIANLQAKTNLASSNVAGIAKLYTTTGNNEDGAMTQKAVYDAIQAGGGQIVVDSALSTSSVYPVQNQAITSTAGYAQRGLTQNLLPLTIVSHTSNNVTYTVNNDGTITISGVPSNTDTPILKIGWSLGQNGSKVRLFISDTAIQGISVYVHGLKYDNTYDYVIVQTSSFADFTLDYDTYKSYQFGLIVTTSYTGTQVILKPTITENLFFTGESFIAYFNSPTGRINTDVINHENRIDTAESELDAVDTWVTSTNYTLNSVFTNYLTVDDFEIQYNTKLKIARFFLQFTVTSQLPQGGAALFTGLDVSGEDSYAILISDALTFPAAIKIEDDTLRMAAASAGLPVGTYYASALYKLDI